MYFKERRALGSLKAKEAQVTAFASVVQCPYRFLWPIRLRLEGPFAIVVASLVCIEKSVFSNTYEDYLVRSRMAKVVSWMGRQKFWRERLEVSRSTWCMNSFVCSFLQTKLFPRFSLAGVYTVIENQRKMSHCYKWFKMM